MAKAAETAASLEQSWPLQERTSCSGCQDLWWRGPLLERQAWALDTTPARNKRASDLTCFLPTSSLLRQPVLECERWQNIRLPRLRSLGHLQDRGWQAHDICLQHL